MAPPRPTPKYKGNPDFRPEQPLSTPPLNAKNQAKIARQLKYHQNQRTQKAQKGTDPGRFWGEFKNTMKGRGERKGLKPARRGFYENTMKG